MRRQIRGAIALKHLMTIRRGKKVYTYFRVKGKPPIRMPDAPQNSPEFLTAYAKALEGHDIKPKAKTGTIAAMIEAYKRSDAFVILSKDYRRIIDRECREIAEQGGDALAVDLHNRHIRADLQALAPHKSRARIRAWRQLCKWAVDAGLLVDDPSDGIKRKAIPATIGHEAWSRAEIAAYRERWAIGTVQRACFELLYWTGCRISDGCKIGPGMIGHEGVLTFRQQKTGDLAYVPWSCAIPRFASAADRDLMLSAIACLSGHMTFLATAQGRTRSVNGLGNLINESAKDAGISKTAHGLRKARAVALAEGGATELQIGSWTGHHSLAEVAHYTQEMDRKSAVIG